MKYFNSVGIVGWQDASVSILPSDPTRLLDVYTSAEQRGVLKSHVKLALLWENDVDRGQGSARNAVKPQPSS